MLRHSLGELASYPNGGRGTHASDSDEDMSDYISQLRIHRKGQRTCSVVWYRVSGDIASYGLVRPTRLTNVQVTLTFSISYSRTLP